MSSKLKYFYRVSIEGTLDERWLRQFEGLSIDQDADGNMCISGEMDQAGFLKAWLGQLIREAGPAVETAALRSFRIVARLFNGF